MLLIDAVESRHRLGQRVSAMLYCTAGASGASEQKRDNASPPGASRPAFSSFFLKFAPLSSFEAPPRGVLKDISVFMYDSPWCTSFTYFLRRAYSFFLFGPIVCLLLFRSRMQA
ncbi:unnamed protein product [Ectocarpus sp. 4 AP-2014]